MPEGRVRDRGQVLQVGGVVLPDLDLALAAGKHGVTHVQVGGEDANVPADVEAVVQPPRQALLDQMDSVGVHPRPGTGFLESREHSVGVYEWERGEAYYLVGCRGEGQNAALVRRPCPADE